MPTHKNTWKAAERKVAAMFGTLRQRLSGSSGRADETAADTKHPRRGMEVKYRAATAVRKLYDETAVKARAESKLPLVVLVDKGKRGFILCLHVDHLPAIAAEIVQCQSTADKYEGFHEEE